MSRRKAKTPTMRFGPTRVECGRSLGKSALGEYRRDEPETIRLDAAGRYEVRASYAGFFGVRCGVQFEDGVGMTGDPVKAAELAAMGFTVTDRGGK